jgi:Ca2+-binding EF-hand superfamily protein
MGKKAQAQTERNTEPAEPTISEETRTQFLKNIRNAFIIFDALGNDTLDIREVGTVLRSLDVFPSEDQLRLWIVEMEEPEPTGYVSYDRFSGVAMRILASGGVKRATEQELFQAFLTLDVEKKGYLLPEELRSYLYDFDMWV